MDDGFELKTGYLEEPPRDDWCARSRAAAILHAEGLSLAEIADAAGVSPLTAQWMVMRESVKR